MKKIYLHLFHILIVGTLFLYVGIYNTKMNPLFYPLLFTLGWIILFYHMYKSYIYLSQGKSAWVNYIHIFIIAPLLLLIGYYREKTSRKYYEILLMLGFASIGYHTYYLLRNE